LTTALERLRDSFDRGEMKDTVYWNRVRYLINHGLAGSEDEIDWTQHAEDEDLNPRGG
jgi:hypothetical protein